MAEVKFDDISPNSDRARMTEETSPPEEEMNDLIEVTPLKKKFIFAKVFEVLGINTDIKGTAQSIWSDVIVPSFLDGCRDSVYTAADYIFGGGGRRPISSKKGKGKNRSNYTPYSEASKTNQPVKQPAQKAYYLEWETREEAVEVKETMETVYDKRGYVTIADMLAADGKTTSNYTLQYWGWYDLRKLNVRTNSNRKYYLDLPRPVVIEEER